MHRCICISCFDQYSTRMKRIIECFHKKGYQVTYLYADFDHYTKRPSLFKHRCGVKIHVPTYSKNISFRRLRSHHLFTKKVIKYMESEEPDIVYCIFPPNSLVKQIAKYKKTHSLKLIFDCYDMWPESFPYDKFKYLFAIPFALWRGLREKYVGNADLILVGSKQGADAIKKETCNIPIKVIRPSIEVGEMPTYNFKIESEITFCYLGMINHIIDIDLGVYLLNQINKKKRVTLHIIGEGQKLEEFVQRLRYCGIKVVCHGVVFDMKEKNKIFSNCDMGLSIPREEIQSTMSLKAIEYLRAGLPFLNGAVGDIEKIVSESKVGVNISKENLTLTINQILSMDNEALEKMHIRCIDVYKEKFAEPNLDDIFNEL